MLFQAEGHVSTGRRNGAQSTVRPSSAQVGRDRLAILMLYNMPSRQHGLDLNVIEGVACCHTDWVMCNILCVCLMTSFLAAIRWEQ